MRRARAPARDVKSPLGELVVTRAAQEWLTPAEIADALGRHAQGDWGDLDPEDWPVSDRTVVKGQEAVSVHTTGDGIKFWIVTAGSRETTMVMLSERYERACAGRAGKPA